MGSFWGIVGVKPCVLGGVLRVQAVGVVVGGVASLRIFSYLTCKEKNYAIDKVFKGWGFIWFGAFGKHGRGSTGTNSNPHHRGFKQRPQRFGGLVRVGRGFGFCVGK